MKFRTRGLYMTLLNIFKFYQICESNAELFWWTEMTLHLHVYRGRAWHSESKERLAEVWVLRHREYHLYSCYTPYRCTSVFRDTKCVNSSYVSGNLCSSCVVRVAYTVTFTHRHLCSNCVVRVAYTVTFTHRHFTSRSLNDLRRMLMMCWQFI